MASVRPECSHAVRKRSYIKEQSQPLPRGCKEREANRRHVASAPNCANRAGGETFDGRLKNYSRQETSFVVEKNQGNGSSSGLIG